MAAKRVVVTVMDMMGGMGPWMMLLWGLVAVVVLGGAIAGIVWLVQQLTERPSHHRIEGAPGSETPGEILRRRYAAGDIDEDEYHRMRRDIGES